jgi:hypothetical protein
MPRTLSPRSFPHYYDHKSALPSPNQHHDISPNMSSATARRCTIKDILTTPPPSPPQPNRSNSQQKPPQKSNHALSIQAMLNPVSNTTPLPKARTKSKSAQTISTRPPTTESTSSSSPRYPSPETTPPITKAAVARSSWELEFAARLRSAVPVENEGGCVWRPRFPGDQWTAKH